MQNQFQPPQIPKKLIGAIIAVLLALFVLVPLSFQFFVSVPVGHISVATLFGKVQDQEYEEGLHFPVNPFYEFSEYDVRQKSHMELVSVPSQDQLTTSIEISVQYRLKRDMASKMLTNTGLAETMVEVHLVPIVRSVLREQGKSVEKAENFFLEETQQTIEDNTLIALQEYCETQGIEIQKVLLREIKLPPFITKAIESKKEREQEVEKQKAELERFKTEQEQVIAEAEAKRKAAEEEAEMRKVLADAQAYEIEKINAAIASNPAYVQLEALKALMAMSKDPAAKFYFMNSDSTMPLPLMHLGDVFQGGENK